MGQDSAQSGQDTRSFYLVAPKIRRGKSPLLVVLHSANRTAYDYLGYQFLDRKVADTDEPGMVMMRVPDEFFALYLNSTNDEWWGCRTSAADGDNKIAAPAERRVLDTIEWVASTYEIDRDRIYLCGASMGGCGALGIGIAHGQIFAAVNAWVPAGVEFATSRFGFTRATSDSEMTPQRRDEWPRRVSGIRIP